jgi:hypothetical protein
MTDFVNHPHLDKSNKHSQSVIQRFWKNVHRRQDHQCWHWIGSKAVRGGYGQLSDRRILLKSHRLSWEINLGSIPGGMMIRHLCHNPSCCNPSHLLPGTAKDNHLDMQKAGRMFVPAAREGKQYRNSRLTEEEVLVIYASEKPGVILAAEYGVSKTMISRIKTGKAWKYLTHS